MSYPLKIIIKAVGQIQLYNSRKDFKFAWERHGRTENKNIKRQSLKTFKLINNYQHGYHSMVKDTIGDWLSCPILRV